MTTRAALLDLAAIEAIVAGNHGDPFGVLGAHNHDGAMIVRTFQPGARSVEAIDAADGRALASLARIDPAGLFEGKVSGGSGRLRYRLRVRWESGTADIEDPYRFPPVLGEVDVHLLAEGNHLRVFEKLGAHPRQMDGVAGVAFAVWAPNARRVSVVGPFNNWDGRRHAMRLRRECGVWEIFIPGLGPGESYKYEIKAMNGDVLPLKADPYAQFQERPPATASVVTAPSTYVWQDEAWMDARAAAQRRDAPISIYEVHLGSWKRKPEEGARYLTYAEMAEDLAPYARDMGFTHIELLPISEYPFDGSWGYQPIGPFAPTSRFGEPDDFRRFVDRCHREGLGVIMDWVPGHFPTDAHGLGMFDGTHLYEHADPRKGKQLDWGTLIYNFGRAEVANFLLSNALYWIERFHIDALRVDAVASMLYLDYSRKPGEWIPNIHGGRENLEAIDFLRRLNELVYARGDGAVTMAEESTSWPMVSRPVHLGGLGFGYKWNMGWMHDTLGYMGQDPIHRRYHQHDLTFGLLYAFTENFILPLSHDEVVHGKGSLIGRMPGDRWQKFANLRAYFGLMYTMPGKKLLFMGGEFAQEREWNHDASLDWHLLDDPFHAGMRRLVGDLNRHYRTRLSLHQLDCEPEGFEWIDCTDADRSILAYLRRARDRDDCTIVVCNFTPVPRHDYRIGAPLGGEYVEILNTDAAGYGGGNIGNSGRVRAESVPWHGQPRSLSLTLPPLSTIVLTPARGGDR